MLHYYYIDRRLFREQKIKEKTMGHTDFNARCRSEADFVPTSFGNSDGKSHFVESDVTFDHVPGFPLQKSTGLVCQTQWFLVIYLYINILFHPVMGLNVNVKYNFYNTALYYIVYNMTPFCLYNKYNKIIT